MTLGMNKFDWIYKAEFTKYWKVPVFCEHVNENLIVNQFILFWSDLVS